MQKISGIFTIASSVLVLTTGLTLPAVSSAGDNSTATVIEEGKKIAFNRKKGNCLACHAIEGGNLPGNIGPPLVAMQARFPDKARLRAQIWDATKANPNTIMPPFGLHKIMSEGEIDKVVEFIYTL